MVIGCLLGMSHGSEFNISAEINCLCLLLLVNCYNTLMEKVVLTCTEWRDSCYHEC